MILVLEDEFLLSIDTKKVPVALHLTSHDVRVKLDLKFQFFAKNPRNMRFDRAMRVDGYFRMEMTIITYTGSFKCITAIFWFKERNYANITRWQPPALPLTFTAYPTLSKDSVVKTFKMNGKDDPTIGCSHFMVELGVLA